MSDQDRFHAEVTSEQEWRESLEEKHPSLRAWPGKEKMNEHKAGLALLRQPFPPNQISKLPKPKSKDSPKGRCPECGGWHGLPAVHLDYVGHAALTDRLLDADPNWTWEPAAVDERGMPLLDSSGGLWIKLTVCGVTRLGYGDAQGKQGGDAMKERIGDALRNAAMRFGAALDLWHKGDLHAHEEAEPAQAAPERPSFRSSPLMDADGKKAIDLLPSDQQEYLRDLAMEIVSIGAEQGWTAANAKINAEKLDNEQRMGLWSILDSKTRSALKSVPVLAKAA